MKIITKAPLDIINNVMTKKIHDIEHTSILKDNTKVGSLSVNHPLIDNGLYYYIGGISSDVYQPVKNQLIRECYS